MDELQKIAKKMMAEKGIEEYNLNIQGTMEKGENYIGEVFFFTITTKTDAKISHFVRKKAKYSKDSEEQSAMKKASQREFYVYRVVYPAMKKFLEDQKNNSALTIIPKLHCIYEEDNKEVLIMGNMKYSGFKMHTNKSPMSHKEICLVLETYAKFHSISFAMKELEPAKFKEVSGSMTDVWINFKPIFGTDNYFEPLLKDGLKELKRQGRSDLVKKYRSIEEDLENVIYVDVEEGDKIAICHGDAWNNNMMFKRKENDEPEAVCLLDFQMSSLSTPALDLGQFLFSAGEKDVLYNIDKYLKLYHDQLTESLKSYGVEIDGIFSFENFMAHWTKYNKTGLIIALCIIQMSLSEAGEIPDDLTLLTYTDCSGMKNAEIFKRRVNDLLISFGEAYL